MRIHAHLRHAGFWWARGVSVAREPEAGLLFSLRFACWHLQLWRGPCALEREPAGLWCQACQMQIEPEAVIFCVLAHPAALRVPR